MRCKPLLNYLQWLIHTAWNQGKGLGTSKLHTHFSVSSSGQSVAEQECIPAECVSPAAVAVSGDLHQAPLWGQTPPGTRHPLGPGPPGPGTPPPPEQISPKPGSPRSRHPRRQTPLPRDQTYINITLSQLRCGQ